MAEQGHSYRTVVGPNSKTFVDACALSSHVRTEVENSLITVS